MSPRGSEILGEFREFFRIEGDWLSVSTEKYKRKALSKQ